MDDEIPDIPPSLLPKDDTGTEDRPSLPLPLPTRAPNPNKNKRKKEKRVIIIDI